jgi:guanylate kinase
LVVCAPSGAGKSTLVKMLLAEFPDFAFSVSYTTRAPRPGEVDGQDYHFTSVERFKERIEEGFFAEWAEVHGNYYGTPRQAALDLIGQGRDVLFDIDVQGAMQLRESLPMACFIFLFPPSYAELRRRLEKRGANSEEDMRRRLDNAAGEMEYARHFDYWIVNDDLQTAYDDLRTVYQAQACRPERNPGLVERLLAEFPQ